jgi:hypothetical protein
MDADYMWRALLRRRTRGDVAASPAHAADGPDGRGGAARAAPWRGHDRPQLMRKSLGGQHKHS